MGKQKTEICEYEETETRVGYSGTATSPYNDSCRMRRDEMTDGSFGYGVDFTSGETKIRFDCMSEASAVDLADQLDYCVSSVDVEEERRIAGADSDHARGYGEGFAAGHNEARKHPPEREIFAIFRSARNQSGVVELTMLPGGINIHPKDTGKRSMFLKLEDEEKLLLASALLGSLTLSRILELHDGDTDKGGAFCAQLTALARKCRQ